MTKWTTDRARRYAIWLTLAAIVGAALWVHWPSVHSGLAADDYLQRAMLDGVYPIARSPLDLYSFKRLPSEASTLDRQRHLALVVAAGAALEHVATARERAALPRLPGARSLGRGRSRPFAALARGVHRGIYGFARRVLPLGAPLIATALMAFDLSLVAPVGWLCNRTALMSATFGVIGLWAYHRMREEGWKPGRWLALGAFCLSLASGEYAICALAFVLAWELVGAQDALKDRLRAALVAFGPALLYASAHVAFGYGAGGSFVYVGPFDSPRVFLEGALLRVPALLTTELVLAPGEWVYFGFLIRAPLTLLAFLPVVPIAVLIVAAVRRADPALRRRLLAWMLGVLLGLVPLSGTLPSVRLLLVPSIGGSLVLGAVIWSAVERLRDTRERRRFVSWAVAIATVPSVLLHGVFSPLLAHFHSTIWRDGVEQVRRSFDDAPLDDARVASQDVFLLSVPNDLIPLMYPPWVRRVDGHPLPKHWRVLASSVYAQKLVRVADDTLDLVVLDGGAMFGGPMSPFARIGQPLPVGWKTRLSGLDVEVLELRGGAPSRVRYRFDGSVDDASRVFIQIQHGRFTRVAMPKLGGELALPKP